jgi:hypothetical protein
MTDNKDILIAQLASFGLSPLEADLYLELLANPSTALQLSRTTGIPRTTIYRVIDQLEKRSLVTRHTDDTGTLLVANDPGIFEVEFNRREEILRAQRKTLSELMPSLASFSAINVHAFGIRTYEGEKGFRQMLWNELKSTTDVLIFGSGTTEEIIPSAHWAKKHRELSLAAGYETREIMNNKPGHTAPPPDDDDFKVLYRARVVDASVLPLENQTSIYNDTVATYHWRAGKKVGVEIINADFANTMRSLFEIIWSVAKPKQR